MGFLRWLFGTKAPRPPPPPPPTAFVPPSFPFAGEILRLPGTVHGKTFNICEFVDPAGLDAFRPRRIPQ